MSRHRMCNDWIGVNTTINYCLNDGFVWLTSSLATYIHPILHTTPDSFIRFLPTLNTQRNKQDGSWRWIGSLDGIQTFVGDFFIIFCTCWSFNHATYRQWKEIGEGALPTWRGCGILAVALDSAILSLLWNIFNSFFFSFIRRWIKQARTKCFFFFFLLLDWSVCTFSLLAMQRVLVLLHSFYGFMSFKISIVMFILHSFHPSILPPIPLKSPHSSNAKRMLA